MSVIGKTIDGKYRILSRIGSGGFATVYRAQDLRDGETVAVKVLHAQYAQDPTFVERFRREARLAHSLTSPYVVRILDYGQFEGQYYLVMEYVRGRTLAQIIRERAPLPVEQALAWARQICEALEAAWRAGIVHRDIKPQNIMITPQGQVKVMDFGIARVPFLSTLTQTGAFLGTPQYMSPEQVKDQPVDTRSDLYSLGIVLYEMLTGRPPFDAESAWAVLRQQTDTLPTPVRARNRQVPPAVETVVMRALAKSRRQRYQTPREMARALAQVQWTKVLPRARPIGATRAWPWLLGVGGGLLLIVALVLGLRGRGQPPPLVFQPTPITEPSLPWTPVSLPTLSPAPIATTKRYDHEVLGLSLQYPASWFMEEEADGTSYVVIFAEEEWLWDEFRSAAFLLLAQRYSAEELAGMPMEKALFEMLLSSEELAGETAQMVLEYGLEEGLAQSGLEDFTVGPVHPCIVGEKEGACVFMEAADTITEISVRGLMALVLTRDVMYLFIAAAEQEVWEEHQPVFEAMLESVHFSTSRPVE